MHDRASAISSDALLRRYAEGGDETAFAELVRRHGRTVGGICHRVIGSGPDAEEVGQAAFALLAQKADGLGQRDESGIVRWLAAVALRLALNRRRVLGRRRHYESAYGEIVETVGPAPGGEMVKAEIDEAIATLPPAMRAVVFARYYRGLGHEEAARELGTTPDAVRGRLHRALKLLRTRLERRGVVATGTGIRSALGGVHRVESRVEPAKSLVLSWVPAGLVPTALSVGWRGAATSVAAVLVVGLMVAGLGSIARESEPSAAQLEAPAPRGLDASPSRENSIPPAHRGQRFAAELAKLGFPTDAPRRIVPDDKNGFDQLERMAEAWRAFAGEGMENFQLDRAMRELTGRDGEWDPDLADAVLAGAAGILAHWEAMLAIPDLQFPEPVYWQPVGYLSDCQAVSTKLKLIEAESALRAGDPRRTVAILTEVIDLAHRFERGGGTHIHLLVGTTQRHSATRRLVEYLDEGRIEMGSTELAELASVHEVLAPDPNLLAESVARDRASMAVFIGQLLDGESAALRTIGNQVKTPVKALSDAFADADPFSIAAELAEIWLAQDAGLNEIDRTEIGGLTGERLALAVIEQINFIDGKSGLSSEGPALSEAASALLQIRIAVERAKTAGRSLEALSDLVPAYLRAIPLDPFDGEPMRFDASRRIAWSVGFDRVDEGGQPREGREGSLRDPKEMVIHLP